MRDETRNIIILVLLTVEILLIFILGFIAGRQGRVNKIAKCQKCGQEINMLYTPCTHDTCGGGEISIKE